MLHRGVCLGLPVQHWWIAKWLFLKQQGDGITKNKHSHSLPYHICSHNSVPDQICCIRSQSTSVLCSTSILYPGYPRYRPTCACVLSKSTRDLNITHAICSWCVIYRLDGLRYIFFESNLVLKTASYFSRWNKCRQFNFHIVSASVWHYLPYSWTWVLDGSDYRRQVDFRNPLTWRIIYL